jgi:hypothetical protein
VILNNDHSAGILAVRLIRMPHIVKRRSHCCHNLCKVTKTTGSFGGEFLLVYVFFNATFEGVDRKSFDVMARWVSYESGFEADELAMW